MHIIKLDAIDSTNAYLKKMVNTKLVEDYTVVVAELQTSGRGQMGTLWQSEDGKNLTTSIYKTIKGLNIDHQFYISMVVSLAICEALKLFNIPKLRIKWPNDILAENKKICGILIENIIKNNTLKGSVIGIGLNINQKYFDNMPQATSMTLLTGILNNKEEILSHILNELNTKFRLLKPETFKSIMQDYEDMLFRKDKPSTFIGADNQIFSGIIKGITNTGKLRVWLEDDIIKTYDFKEVTMHY